MRRRSSAPPHHSQTNRPAPKHLKRGQSIPPLPPASQADAFHHTSEPQPFSAQGSTGHQKRAAKPPFLKRASSKTTATQPPLGTGKANSLHHATSKRLIWMVLLFLGLFMVILGRLVYLQLIIGPSLAHKAKEARSYSVTLFHRGNILDRHGNVLAQDEILYDAFAHPQYFHDVTPRQIAQAIAPILKVPAQRLTEQLSRPYSTIRLASNLPYQTVQDLKRIKVMNQKGKTVTISGLDFPKKTVRRYPQGSLAAHVVGYVNDDASASSGVEWSQHKKLKHLAEAQHEDNTTDASALLNAPLLDGKGHLMAVEDLHTPEVVALPRSDDVTLTLDTRLQFLAEQALTEGIQRAKAQRGAVIMMTPKTGEILAFAVAPTYSPEHYYRASYTTLKNWALSDVYPPGSTMKILTVANGIESGAITPDSRILDTGRMKIEGWTIQNYDYYRRPHPGMIDLVYLFEHSSNIASAKISMMTPRQRQFELLNQFGLGQKTDIALPGESAGILPDPKTWTQSSHASLGYGYGLAATPLQMAAAVGAIANNGVWVQPHVLKKPLNQLNRRRVLSKETAQAVQQLLETSIARAHTSTVRIPGLRIAGKTGTSRKPNANGRGYSNDIFTSFVGFYPAENPKILMFVVVDSPRMAESWGSTVAGPIFKQIAENSLEYLGLKGMATATPQ